MFFNSRNVLVFVIFWMTMKFNMAMLASDWPSPCLVNEDTDPSVLHDR